VSNEHPLDRRAVDLLEQTGASTGAEIYAALGGETLPLWRTCLSSPELTVRRVGRRYVRLDRRVEGYARLSPSILREFLTYSVVGLAADSGGIDRRVQAVKDHIEDVSRAKLTLAKTIMTGIAEPLARDDARDQFCVVVAGDIVYGMAHDVDRPERSTGILVRGSDLDIVVVVSDDAPDELVARLDAAIYRQKYQYLKNPAFHEEIDYVVKRLATLREQAEFDTVKRMVACKIIDEAVLLFGNANILASARALLAERGVTERLREMEQVAIRTRQERESYLLSSDQDTLDGNDRFLFHTDDESEEFE
jgi:hypothetical protein